MKRYFLSLFLILFSLGIYAQKAVIKGKNQSYAGYHLQVRTYSDPITYTEKVLAEGTVAPDGTFRIELESKETQLAFLPMGIYKGFLFVEPGIEYEVKLPPFQEKQPAEKLNPYFEAEELLLGIAGADPKELNVLIRKFDDQLDAFINQNFYKIYRKKEQSIGIGYAQELQKEFGHYENTFFKNYLEYRLGLLEFLSNPRSFGQLEKKYFHKRKVLFNNPAYTSLFKKLYGNFLTGYMDRKEGPAIKTAFSSANPYQELSTILSKYESYQDGNLRDLILLCGLHDGFSRKFFSRKNVLAVSEVMTTKAGHAFNRDLAQNMTRELKHLRPGQPAPEFALTDGEDTQSLKDYQGKYLYLSFCNTKSYACQQDFEELEKLYQQFGKEIQFLTIATDWKTKDFEAWRKNKEYSWPMIHIGDQQTIAHAYNVRAYPTYFLIDPKGNIVKAPAPGPKEYIEQEFIKIRREALRQAYQKQKR